MQPSFTAQDAREILIAVPLLAPYLLLPGYGVGYTLNTLGFRLAPPPVRLALSLALSLAIVPIAVNLASRLIPVPRCAFLLAGVSLLLTCAALLHEARTRHQPYRWCGTRAITCLAGAWIVLCLLSFPDLQIGTRLWNSVLIYDGGLRAAFIDAVLRTGVPPKNPLCFFGAPIPSRYYYYWSTVCAMPAVLGHLPARAVLAASSVWTGFALSAMIPLFLRDLLHVPLHLRRWSLIGIALLAVTGLDLLPTAISWAAQGFVFADMEWWDVTEIPSWIDSVLWTPHHVAGLLCCLFGFLLLWPLSQPAAQAAGTSATGTERRGGAANVVLASLAFASAAGLSVYLLFSFGLFLAAWVLRLLLRGRARSAAPFLTAGLIAILLSLPLLHDLRQPAAHQIDAHSGKPAHLITTGLRTSGWVKTHLGQMHGWRLPLLVADLLVTYIFEFGFSLLVACIVTGRLWRKRRTLTEADVALSLLLATTTLVMTFLRSEAIRSNDLGMRTPLLAQFVLLLWAIPLVDGLFGQRAAPGLVTTLLRTTLLLGVCASVYQVLLLRLAAPLDALAAVRHRAVAPIAFLPVRLNGATIFELSKAEAALTPQLPSGSVVGFNINNEDGLLLLADTHTQIAASSPENCGTPFGGLPAQCDHTKAILRSIFEPGTAGSVRSVAAACLAASIDVLLVQPSDPVWSDARSWVWQGPVLVSSPALRAIWCGGPEPGKTAALLLRKDDVLR